MGVSKYDNAAGDRRLSAKYALNSSDGVRLLLGDYHALTERQFQGDYDATVILCDLATAIEAAGLTDRQREALRLVFNEDLTQKDAGLRMGIAQQNVEVYVANAIDKIAEIYFYWSGHGEGYSIEGGTA